MNPAAATGRTPRGMPVDVATATNSPIPHIIEMPVFSSGNLVVVRTGRSSLVNMSILLKRRLS